MADLYDDLDTGDKATKEEMKAEALRRMKILGMNDIAIEWFKNGKLTISETVGRIVFINNINNEAQKIVDNHEKEYGEFIYHVIHSFSNIGETYECLFVSQYKEDWTYENDMLKRNIVYAYVENKSAPENSEAGSIMVENIDGVLIRTA